MINKDAKILEFNSKTGLYPLYVTISLSTYEKAILAPIVANIIKYSHHLSTALLHTALQYKEYVINDVNIPNK